MEDACLRRGLLSKGQGVKLGLPFSSSLGARMQTIVKDAYLRRGLLLRGQATTLGFESPSSSA